MNMVAKNITAERRNACRFSFACECRELAVALDRAYLSTSTEETRYYLCGVFLAFDPKSKEGVQLVATDGHRLTAVSLQTATTPSGAFGVILARKAARDLAKVVRRGKRQSAVVTVERWEEQHWTPGEFKAGWVDRYRVQVEVAGVAAVDVPWIDGTFPDWQRVLPRLDKGATSLTFDAADLRATLAPWRVRDEPGKTFQLATNGATEAVLTARHQDAIWGMCRRRVGRGRARGQVVGGTAVVGYHERIERRYVAVHAPNAISGDAITAFNIRYVLDLLPAKGRVTFRGYHRDGGPWRIECENEPAATVVIMPCRV